MNQKDVILATLEKINLATAGAVSQHPGSKITFEPLLTSSASAAPISAQRFNALTDPASLRDGFKPTGIHYAFAARITGPIDSAFPQGAPADQKPAAGPPAAHLAKSQKPANIVVVADTDLLMDYMWVQTRELFGQKVAQPFANNADFVANILDNLSGSSALISVRGRASFSVPSNASRRCGARPTIGCAPKRSSCKGSCSRPRPSSPSCRASATTNPR